MEAEKKVNPSITKPTAQKPWRADAGTGVKLKSASWPFASVGADPEAVTAVSSIEGLAIMGVVAGRSGAVVLMHIPHVKTGQRHGCTRIT